MTIRLFGKGDVKKGWNEPRWLLRRGRDHKPHGYHVDGLKWFVIEGWRDGFLDLFCENLPGRFA